MYAELLMGCGSNSAKRVYTQDGEGWKNLVRLDNNPAHRPDVLHDLNEHPLPFADDMFDEIHAYEVLEHLGSQGDYKFFFSEWNEYYRILKPGGVFCATVPMWTDVWAWGDPSHTRVIPPQTLIFLNQKEYDDQVGTTSLSDFRQIYHGDFKPVYLDDKNGTFIFVLESQKPKAVLQA